MNEVNEAVVLAGGLGSRLRTVVADVPKPMAPVAGRPFLTYLLDYLMSQGIRRVVLSVGYRHEAITAFFGKTYGTIEIVYSIEDEPLGTGGGIALALAKVESSVVFVLNGDTFLKLDYRAMAGLANEDRDDFTLAVALREVDDTSRYGRAILEGDYLLGFAASGTAEPGLINAGVYLMSARIFGNFGYPARFSFEKDFLERRASHIRPRVFRCNVPFIDIGIPDALRDAQFLLPEWTASL